MLKTKSHTEKMYPAIFVLLPFAIYVILVIIPSLSSFYFALTDWNADRIHHPVFIGFENFKEIFRSEDLTLGITNTLIFTVVTTVFKCVLGLLLAIALNNLLVRSRNILRTIFYIPGILSTVVIGLSFSAILHPEGLLNRSLRSIGLYFLEMNWLVDQGIAMLAISAVDVWKSIGFVMIIFIAGLQAISKQYYEAAMIDGANALHRFYYITVPGIMPAFNVNFILSLIGGLKVFEQVYILTNGGPGNRTQVVSTWIYKMFGTGQWGMGNALNIVLTFIVAVIVVLSLSILRRREVEV